EPEEENVERQKKNDRDGINPGEQRLEHANAVWRAADEIAGDDAGACRNRKRGRKLGKRDTQIAEKFTRSQDVEKVIPYRDGVRQEEGTDAPAGGGDIPEHDQREQKRDLNGARCELSLFVKSHLSAPPAARLSGMLFLISSWRRS